MKWYRTQKLKGSNWRGASCESDFSEPAVQLQQRHQRRQETEVLRHPMRDAAPTHDLVPSREHGMAAVQVQQTQNPKSEKHELTYSFTQTLLSCMYRWSLHCSISLVGN
jgi:hypothetical protein